MITAIHRSLLLFTFTAVYSQAQDTPSFPVISTFDGGLDGWVATGTEFSYLTSGGNPDGYLRHNDATTDDNRASAPSRFLGNWSSLNEVGVIIFDHQVFTTGNGSPNPYKLFIDGPGGSAEWIGLEATVIGNWVTIRVPLKQSEWIIRSGNWSTILQNITSFRVQVELFSQSSGPRDQNGIDNVFVGRETGVGVAPQPTITFKPVISFLSQPDTIYVIETSDDMDTFTTLATIIGNGSLVNYTDVRDLSTAQFYRISIE